MIEPKVKPCRGIGKAKGFKGCGKPVKFRRYGLGVGCCYPYFILNTDAEKILLAKATIKATKPRKELKKAFQEKKNRNKITDLISAVKDVCHKYIRLRDEYKPCISCNAPYHKDHQAGHFYKAELFSSIKFHEDNIHGQCRKCNLRKEGNESEYRVNLPYRIGQEKFDKINFLASLEKVKNFKWDREELKKTRTYYNQKIKELKKQEA